MVHPTRQVLMVPHLTAMYHPLQVCTEHHHQTTFQHHCQENTVLLPYHQDYMIVVVHHHLLDFMVEGHLCLPLGCMEGHHIVEQLLRVRTVMEMHLTVPTVMGMLLPASLAMLSRLVLITTVAVRTALLFLRLVVDYHPLWYHMMIVMVVILVVMLVVTVLGQDMHQVTVPGPAQ